MKPNPRIWLTQQWSHKLKACSPILPTRITLQLSSSFVLVDGRESTPMWMDRWGKQRVLRASCRFSAFYFVGVSIETPNNNVQLFEKMNYTYSYHCWVVYCWQSGTTAVSQLSDYRSTRAVERDRKVSVWERFETVRYCIIFFSLQNQLSENS